VITDLGHDEYTSRLVPGIQTVVCGSYRRGSNTCGDVDVLFSPPEVSSLILIQRDVFDSGSGSNLFVGILVPLLTAELAISTSRGRRVLWITAAALVIDPSNSQGREHVDILPALIESLSKSGFLTDHLAMPHTHAEAEAQADGAVDKGGHREGVDSREKRGQGRRWEKKPKGSHLVQTNQDESNTEADPESISSGR
jgi:hypothetical protein